MKLRWLIIFGLLAFVAFAIVSLPASVLFGFLQNHGVTAVGTQGSVWKGRAQMLQIQGANVGAIEWDLHALALLGLKLKADVTLTRAEGVAQTTVSLRSIDAITFEDLDARLPLAALSGLAPAGWGGTVNLRFDELQLNEGWPRGAIGTAEILNLTSSSQASALSGSYQITFPSASVEPGENVVAGDLVDLGGPLQLTGELQLRPDRSYLLTGMVAARPEAPPNLANQLQILGPPDAEGRRPFSLEGTL